MMDLGRWSSTLGLLLAVGSIPLFAQHEAGSASIYLVGDAGMAGEDHSAPVMRLIQEVAKADSADRHLLIFLGGNIYPNGLHKKNDPQRARDDAALAPQLQAAHQFPGSAMFIPGEQDWENGGTNGWDFVQREEQLVQDTLGNGSFQPNHGCPGPEVMELDHNTVLIFIDTQWWLQLNKRPEGTRDGCEVATETEFLNALADLLKGHRDKQIIIVGHHPLYSYGEHGGYFSWKDHLFPLTRLNKYLWLPLPLVGSIYPTYRKLIGTGQDLSNARYKSLQTGIENLLLIYPGVVYAAGHEHDLEYLVQDSIHYVVSGAGSTSSHLHRSAPLSFGIADRGFAHIDIEADGSMALDFFTLTGLTTPVFSKPIQGPPKGMLLQLDTLPMPLLPDSVEVVPDPELSAGKFKRFILGNLYRDLWATPIKVPVLHLDSAFGGLTPKRTGGNEETISLRLKDAQGHAFELRTVRKFPDLGLHPKYRGTVVDRVVTDGIAANHPYATLVVATLSNAVHVLHPKAWLVYVGDDPGLGIYRKDYRNTLYLLEERPRGDWSDTPNFGSSKNLTNTTELIDALRISHKAVLDQRAMLRTSLLDMLLGDWDRHDGQIGWATTPLPHGRTLYEPVPHDRDEVFFRQDGVIPDILQRKWLLPKFQPFGPEIKNVEGLNFQARYYLRAFLTGLDRSTWKSIADSMRMELTDSVFTAAIAQLPVPAQRLMGTYALNGLKGRRDRLDAYADRLYLDLAKYVDLAGTDQAERFTVKRREDGSTQVEIWDTSEKGNDERVYQRVFLPSETKEIRLYGIAGKDDFEISGRARKAIKLRIILGEDRSVVRDSSHVSGCGKHTLVYTSKGRINKQETHLSKDARLVKSPARIPVEYVRDEFVPDILAPDAAVGYNKDDGLFLGGGFTWTKQGFKAEPFKWQHRALVSVAFKTGAYNFHYSGKVNHVLGRTGFGLELDLLAPDYKFNYFGLGNTTARPANENRYRYRIDMVDASPYAERTFSEVHHVRVGGRYLLASQNMLNSELEGHPLLPGLDVSTYVGGFLGYTLLNVDNVKDPHRGARVELGASTFSELEKRTDVLAFKADLRGYFPLYAGNYRGVLAARIGGERNAGDIDPITAATLGGMNEMRGLRRDRFSGNLTAYGNIELRSDILTWKNSFIPFRVGVIALADAGRVWLFEAPNAPVWHHAFGGGIYISPLNMIVLQATYSASDDDALVDVRLGFFF